MLCTPKTQFGLLCRGFLSLGFWEFFLGPGFGALTTALLLEDAKTLCSPVTFCVVTPSDAQHQGVALQHANHYFQAFGVLEENRGWVGWSKPTETASTEGRGEASKASKVRTQASKASKGEDKGGGASSFEE